jgi:FkbM family methyltransferase
MDEIIYKIYTPPSQLKLRFLPKAIRKALSCAKHFMFQSGPRKVLIRDWLFPVRNFVLHNKPILVGMKGLKLFLEPSGSTAADIWSNLRLERAEIAFITGLLGEGMTFFDVGANAGIFSIAAAKTMPGGRVFAFEPCLSTFALLIRNCRLNHIGNMKIERLALGDYYGQATLQVNKQNKDGLNTLGTPSHSDSEVVRQEIVPLKTLDMYIVENNISKVDVLKVDAEGSELLIFRGARKLLMREDAPIILCECYSWCTEGFGYHPVEIMWLLTEYGYSLATLDTCTSVVAPRQPRSYDVMLVATKPCHDLHAQLYGGHL